MGDLSTFTPEISTVIRKTIDTEMMEKYFCLPAKIVTYDSSTQYASVEVSLYQAFNDDSLLPYPVIPMVPVKHPRAMGGKVFMHINLFPGDDVTLVFSQRSLDNWKNETALISDPDDPRKNHLADAFALIGGSSIPNAFSPPSGGAALDIVCDQLKMSLYPTGQLEISNDTAEFVQILDSITDQVSQMAQNLGDDTVNTIFGPQPLRNFAAYNAIYAQLVSLKTQLESFLE